MEKPGEPQKFEFYFGTPIVLDRIIGRRNRRLLLLSEYHGKFAHMRSEPNAK